MKANILDREGKKLKSIDLPIQFSEEYRPDIIKKAVLAVQANNRQPYGSDPRAGKRAAVRISKRRRGYKTCYGKGISRVPRKTLSRMGQNFSWVGAFAPGTVGGRRAHPPKAEKIWSHNINIKEKRLAIRSAIASTAIKTLVEKRGHSVGIDVPLIVDSSIEGATKTKDIILVLKKLGLGKELERLAQTSIRAGRGKSRGRKYKTKVGPLIVVSEKCPLMQSVSNIKGIDIINVNMLNASLLAPGCHAGRLTIWSDKAIEKLDKEKLFLNAKKESKAEGKK